jgi:hypothetical protein
VSTALVLAAPDLAAALAPETERARDYASASKAKSSLRAYASQWRLFSRWCTAHGLDSLPAEARTVALYLAARADAGRTIPIPRARTPELCPERALCAWIGAAAITDGPLFRRVDRWGHVGGRLAPAAVATVVKEAATRAGLDPRLFAGPSSRSGLVTTAARAGKGELAIMRITGHASVTMLRRYIKEAERWRDVPTDGLLEG